MSGREAWLAHSAEPALDPDLPICDPHHHFWVYPDSRYLVEEFAADAAGGHRVCRTVFVECLMFYRQEGPDALRPVGETQYVDGLANSPQARAFGMAEGIIGFADLRMGEAVQHVLDAHREASPRFRGIRFATACDPAGGLHAAHTRPVPGLLADAVFRAGVRRLAESGLSFDAWVYFSQLGELEELARAFPALPIVLDHTGGIAGIGAYAGRREEVFACWQRDMTRLAARPNVMVKLGGLTMSLAGFAWHKRELPPSSDELAAAMRPYFLHCIERFGVERCMFESNFPVDRLSCSYTVLWNAFKKVAAGFSAAERSALFHDNAVRAYRLEARTDDLS